MSYRIPYSAVQAHNNGDCWPDTCSICEIEERQIEDEHESGGHLDPRQHEDCTACESIIEEQEDLG